MRAIYERSYDNPIAQDGTKKPNKLLGCFEVIEQIYEDSYAETFLGLRGKDVYLVTGTEVSGYNGGMRYTVKKLEAVTAVTDMTTERSKPASGELEPSRVQSGSNPIGEKK